MKPKLLHFVLLICAVSFWSCNDQCTETRVTRQFTTLVHSLEKIRSEVKVETPRTLESPGKMYVKGKYLFVNEIKKGIHIIDNSDTRNPKFVSFINIPGNGDIAVRGNTLYADSFSDLLAIDITDPEKAVELNRIQNVFQNGMFDGGIWTLNSQAGVIHDKNVSFLTETIAVNCDNNVEPLSWWGIPFAFADRAVFSSASSASPQSAGNGNGQAGSMSRFALHQQFLYTVSNSSLHLFDIANAAKPVDFATIDMGWGIETIFPYNNKLFIGSSTGMFIYDNSNPSAPKQLSVFQHARACDPVVVHDDIAYVTLRTGNACTGAQNQLDLVDVSNPSNPRLIKTYPMDNPHGLSINFPTLYLCEGERGLKIFDVADKLGIDKNQIAHFKGMDAFDVIYLDKTLLLIGKDGFYQYDASNPKDIKLLSKIPVSKTI